MTIGLISIDLAIRQTGIAYFDATGHLVNTVTIPKTLGTRYKVLDLVELASMSSPIGFGKYLEKGVPIIVEWNTSALSHLLEKFTISAISYWYGLGYDVIPVQANHWIKVADRVYAVKRNKYPPGRENNKRWIHELASRFWPKWEFKSQDEMDAAVMGITYLNNKICFK